MSRDCLFLIEFADWLQARARERPGRFVFLTLSFDRYRKYYLPQGSDPSSSPSRIDVRNGLAIAMPTSAGKSALVADLDQFYCFLLRALFGKRYSRHFKRQPVGIGALDEPRYKSARKRSSLSRAVGDIFDHAHFVLFLPEIVVRGGSLVSRFVDLTRNDQLQQFWRRLNPEGEVHISEAFELLGALDYAFKTAKLQAVPADELLLWPVAIPQRRQRLTGFERSPAPDVQEARRGERASNRRQVRA